MIRNSFIVMLVLLIISPSLFGQEKVGTVNPFATFSSSARANGMGQTGVTSIHNASVYYNPGSLGLLAHENNVALTFIPGETELFTGEDNSRFHCLAVGIPLEKIGLDRVAIGLAHYRTRNYFSFTRTNEFGHLQGIIFWKHVAESYSLGIGYNGFFEFGGGITAKYLTISENWPTDTTVSAWSADIGLLTRMRLGERLNAHIMGGKFMLVPAVGISWTDIDFDTDIKLIETNRLGISLMTGCLKTGPYGDWLLWSFTPVVERIKTWGIYGSTKISYAGELGILETVHFRAGTIKAESEGNELDTWGLGLNSRGLVICLSNVLGINTSGAFSKTCDFLINHLSMELSYSRYGHESIFDGINFYELSINYNL